MFLSREFSAPGKLILSGEHAVLHGCPALAVAVDRYVKTTVKPHTAPTIIFKLLNLPYVGAKTLSALRHCKEELQQKYHLFTQGECSIKEVLKTPFELVQYTASSFIDKLQPQLHHGVEIHTQSSIPVGCGMGSSAATIVSALYALAALFESKRTHDFFLKLGKEIEHLQHGRSSGLDLYLSIHGGCVLFTQGTMAPCSLPNLTLRIVNTGKPLSSTGECVGVAASHFKGNTLQPEFTAVTEAMAAALEKNDAAAFKQAVKANHRLLLKLGVVPEKVAAFIADIEKTGNSAKICGAGAVTGEQGGVVLIAGDAPIHPVLERYGYGEETTCVDHLGVNRHHG